MQEQSRSRQDLRPYPSRININTAIFRYNVFDCNLNPRISPLGSYLQKWTFGWGLFEGRAYLKVGGLIQSLTFSSEVDRKVTYFSQSTQLTNHEKAILQTKLNSR